MLLIDRAVRMKTLHGTSGRTSNREIDLGKQGGEQKDDARASCICLAFYFLPSHPVRFVIVIF